MSGFWNRGFATEMAAASLDVGFGQLGFSGNRIMDAVGQSGFPAGDGEVGVLQYERDFTFAGLVHRFYRLAGEEIGGGIMEPMSESRRLLANLHEDGGGSMPGGKNMKPTKPRLPPQIVGNAGLFYVCYKLSVLGWNAMPTSRNARGVDVMCYSLDGKKKCLIQVKSCTELEDTSLGSDLQNLMADFWIVVTNALETQPTCYVFAPYEVTDLARHYQGKY